MFSKEEIFKELQSKYSGLVLNQNWGETGLFYNPDLKLKKGIYLLTIKEKDGNNDSSSNLNRVDHFRLNIGISKPTFMKMFGRIPVRPSAGEIINMDYDFSAVDKIMPHPVYGWMAWICVINPSSETFKTLIPLINEGYKLALEKYSKKMILNELFKA
jgi:hypothetical protein